MLTGLLLHISYGFRPPEVPQTQPKPAVPAPQEAPPVAKSWANTKQGGQGDGKWRWAGLVGLAVPLCIAILGQLVLIF